MERKLIRLENHFILVDDSEVKDDDYYYTKRFSLCILQNSGDSKIEYWNNKNSYSKITHSTYAIDTFSDIGRLSLKNCEDIERGYDLDELVKEEAKKRHDWNKHRDTDIYNELVREDAELIKIGFQKALELIKHRLVEETEWKVEILMDICGDKVYAVPEIVLDADGCLILKRL